MVYLVDCRSELALIDAGVNTEIGKICENIKTVGLNPNGISTLFITHSHIDHFGGAHSFRRKYGCKTVAHELDSDAIETADSNLTGSAWYNEKLVPCIVDIKLSGSEGDFRVGSRTFKWVHTPGHTPGGISILLNTPHGDILFAQDLHGPFMPEFRSNISEWAESMRKIIDLDFDILAEGHFGIYKPKKRAVAYIQSYLKRYGYASAAEKRCLLWRACSLRVGGQRWIGVAYSQLLLLMIVAMNVVFDLVFGFSGL